MRRNTEPRLSGMELTLIGLLCLAVYGALHIGNSSYRRSAVAAGVGLVGSDIDLRENQNKAYEQIVSAVTPAIVSIRTEQVIKMRESPFFMDPFLRQFFGDSFSQIPREQRQHALGSGVLVDSVGHIITNNHVIEHASTIEVLLKDHRTFKAKLVGTDPDADIAVVKIDARSVPTASLGDSSNLHVGDTVMAFGN